MRIARRLIENGHTAYFAGGCVRDRLLGIEPTDYDVATSALPDDVQALFRNSHAVGQAFGVVLVRCGGHTFDVATFRTDGDYSDSRRPDQVTFTDAEHDARRRDFTINGLFEDPLTGEVIDHVGGQADLEARVVRAIGSPADRLHEDQLRSLRAVRFAARFGFTLDPETAEAIRSVADELRGVSRERIGQEVRRMLTHANRGVAAWELQYLGLDVVVLCESGCLNAPTRLGRLPDEIAVGTALAAWAIDRHGLLGPDTARELACRWREALMLSNEDFSGLLGALNTCRSLHIGWSSLGVAAQKRLAASESFEPALAILRAVERDRFIEVRRQVDVLAATGLAPAPLVTGTDLIEAGLEPGPLFSRVLEAVYDAQLEAAILSREEAMQLAQVLARELGG